MVEILATLIRKRGACHLGAAAFGANLPGDRRLPGGDVPWGRAAVSFNIPGLSAWLDPELFSALSVRKLTIRIGEVVPVVCSYFALHGGAPAVPKAPARQPPRRAAG
jgi:hypothetical protein